MSDTKWFWSCKLKRPDTLMRHKKFETAAKQAGHYGFVYAEDGKTVKQIFQMSKYEINAVDVDMYPSKCVTLGFDMREVLRSFRIIE